MHLREKKCKHLKDELKRSRKLICGLSNDLTWYQLTVQKLASMRVLEVYITLHNMENLIHLLWFQRRTYEWEKKSTLRAITLHAHPRQIMGQVLGQKINSSHTENSTFTPFIAFW